MKPDFKIYILTTVSNGAKVSLSAVTVEFETLEFEIDLKCICGCQQHFLCLFQFWLNVYEQYNVSDKDCKSIQQTKQNKIMESNVKKKKKIQYHIYFNHPN